MQQSSTFQTVQRWQDTRMSELPRNQKPHDTKNQRYSATDASTN